MSCALNVKLSDSDFRRQKIFFFKDLDEQDLSSPGIYCWYVCPKIFRFESVEDFYGYHKISLKIVKAFFEYQVSVSDLHFEGIIAPGGNSFFSKKFTKSISSADLLNFHRMIPAIFLSLPPVRVGLAVEQSLSERLKQYRNNGIITTPLRKVGTSQIDLNSFLIRTYEFDRVEGFETQINIFESWILSCYKPILNKEF